MTQAQTPPEAKKHSLIGPSAASRTIACPGWVGLYQDFLKQLTAQLGRSPGRRSSRYSAEGTLAHRIAEDILNGKPAPNVGDELTEEGFAFKIDEDFLRDVQVYVDFVIGLRALGYRTALEVEVDISPLWDFPNMTPPPERPFGTADTIAYHAAIRHLTVADLKFGRGVSVSAINNAQLRYYALGACLKFKLTPRRITLVIVQPRAENPEGRTRSETITYKELVAWAVAVLRPAIDQAFKPGAPLKMGDHCQFCPAQPVCPEKRRMAQNVARHIFADNPVDLAPKPDTKSLINDFLTPNQLGALLLALDDLEAWTTEIREAAQAFAEHGGAIDGWKLVDKQARRRWSDVSRVREILVEANLSPQEFLDMDLKSPNQILKHPQVKKNQELIGSLEDLVSRQSSGVTLVSSVDPRPAVQARPTAREVFSKPAEL